MAEPFAYDIIVSPGEIDENVKEKWLARLTDPATIETIKTKVSEIDWRQVLDMAAKGFSDFMGSDDPRRALAALKHSASLAVADADAAKQKLIETLDSGAFSDAVKAKAYKFAARTAYVLPATRAVKAFTEALGEWLMQIYGAVGRYLRAASVGPAVFATYLGVVFADAVAAGRVDENQAEQILQTAADELKQVLDIVMAQKGVTATVSVDIDAPSRSAKIHVEIPAPSQ